jgi:hypothetical protein
MKNKMRIQWIGGALALAGALLMNTAPAMAQGYGPPPYNQGYAAPAGSYDNLVSRIALYPDPLLAQIFAAAAFPDQVAAAAQGQPGPFDPSIEALMQYPSVLQMMASDPGWTQSLGQAMAQDQAGVMDAIQNLRREAQQYGYLQSGPQMQVMDSGGYIDIEPVGGYMYVPMYDPYVVFAAPRPGFFIGGAIRFGGGFRWAGGYGYNRFNWGGHQVFVNRQVWRPTYNRTYIAPQRGFEQRGFQQRGFEQRGYQGVNRGWNGNAMPQQAPRQNFAPQQGRSFGQPRNFSAPQQNFAAPQQRNFNAAPQQQQRNFAPQQQQRNFAPQQQQRNFAPQQRQMEQRPAPQFHSQGGGGGGHFQGGGGGHEGHGRR